MAFADDFKLGIDRAVRIIQMDRAAINEVAADANALPVGVAIVALAGVAGGIGGLLKSGPIGGIVGLIAMPMAAVVFSFIWTGILYLVGMLFKPPSWDFQQLYRGLSHVQILGVAQAANIVPILGLLIVLAATIYQVVLTVITVQEVGKVDLVKAILIVLIPGAVCCGLAAAAFAMIFGLAALGIGAALGR
jgi:hypothetical protein